MKEVAFTIILTGGATWDDLATDASIPTRVKRLQFKNRSANDVKYTDQSDGDPYDTIPAGIGYDTGLAPVGVWFSPALYLNGTAADVIEGTYIT